MSSPDLPQLLKRLETVTVRLEDLASKGGVATLGKTSSTLAASSDSTAGASSPSLDAFEDILNGPFKAVIDNASKVGGVVVEQVTFFIIIIAVVVYCQSVLSITTMIVCE